ncbi:hypothetical protein [Paenibacillus sp. HGF5]|uniref:hypothetical protein n=1 Tax=Paenibacillus sp. HGF5 TaxID=908341 RepID=UPI0002071A88|nr:hypothetical protein [Paenibacillus sp. HGF5]EGG33990.1 hypothetical protein HMPREF9412_3159 [Paenibacillus sp. HGF5]
MSKYLKAMTLSTAMLLTLSAGVVVAYPDVLQSYSSKNEVEIQHELKKLDKQEFVTEFDEISKKIDPVTNVNELIPFAAELFDRDDEFSNEELLSLIKDTEKTIVTRNAMLELYQAKNKNNRNNELKELLKDKSFDREIQEKIIATTHFEKADVPLLESLVLDQEEMLSFQAMKQLRSLDKELALSLSQDILNEYKNYPEEKISAALKATSHYIKSNNSEKASLSQNSQATELINISLDIINSENYSPKLKDSAFFATSDLRSKEAILTILKQSNVDRELIVYAIDQNFYVLNEILLNDPSLEEIELIINAMEMHPITDLYDSLNTVISNVKDDNLRERGEKALAHIKEEGTKGNHKWLDSVGGGK